MALEEEAAHKCWAICNWSRPCPSEEVVETGNDPVKLLMLKSNQYSCVSAPSPDGMVPVSWFPFSALPHTSPKTQNQVNLSFTVHWQSSATEFISKDCHAIGRKEVQQHQKESALQLYSLNYKSTCKSSMKRKGGGWQKTITHKKVSFIRFDSVDGIGPV